jgi:hypothetical protein
VKGFIFDLSSERKKPTLSGKQTRGTIGDKKLANKNVLKGLQCLKKHRSIYHILNTAIEIHLFISILLLYKSIVW